MYCKNCGKEIKEGAKFCGECGATIGEQDKQTLTKQVEQKQEPKQQKSAQYGGYAESNYQRPVYGMQQIPSEYKPISMWGYFGWDLLFCIPCAGFIVLIVFALGGTQNINLKNYARSKFCFLIIALAIILIFGLGFGMISATSIGFLKSV